MSEQALRHRQAAGELYALFASVYRHIRSPLWGDDARDDKTEARLVTAVEDAREHLAAFRRARALRRSIDVLTPVWFDLDVSDHVAVDGGTIFATSVEDAMQQLADLGVTGDVLADLHGQAVAAFEEATRRAGRTQPAAR